MDALLIGQAAFCLGFVLYLATLPLVICRMIKRKAMLEPLKLTTAIFTAPMSLSIVGYFNVFEQKSEILVYTMLIAAVAIYLYVSVKMVSLLRVKFYPTYVAFTFPYVISAIAFRIGNGFLIERGMSFFAPFATLSMWIAIALVIYVLAHYVRYFGFWLKF
jgi:exfoliative toxin A/B